MKHIFSGFCLVCVSVACWDCSHLSPVIIHTTCCVASVREKTTLMIPLGWYSCPGISSLWRVLWFPVNQQPMYGLRRLFSQSVTKIKHLSAGTQWDVPGFELSCVPVVSHNTNETSLYVTVVLTVRPGSNVRLLWIHILFCAQLIFPGATEPTKKSRKWGLHFLRVFCRLQCTRQAQ